jgi:hypothetical protein
LDTTGADYNNAVINVDAQAAGTFGIRNGRWTISLNTIGDQEVQAFDPVSYNILGLGDHA